MANHLVDEYAAGSIDRREFVRRAVASGMSFSAVSLFVAACGGGQTPKTSGTPATGAVKPGGRVGVGVQAPAGALDPVKVNSGGGIATIGQTGEYLAWCDAEFKLQPRLAESWTPSEDGAVWTFKIRQGVKFHDGSALTARDVVATFDRLTDPAHSSNALSTFRGVLSKGGASAPDDQTVRFELDAPVGNFPYIASSDNYNSIILPRTYDGDWEKTFIGTGPWKLEKYTPNVGVSLVRNPEYWDSSRRPNPERVELRFYAKEQASVLGLQSGEVDMVLQFSVTGGRGLLNDPQVQVLKRRSTAHRQVHMRTDIEPFNDKRVRQALALLINRDGLVEGLFDGNADLGNDHPFAPIYQSSDPSVPQRTQDVEKAKQLLDAAGRASGFSVELRTWDGFEIPDLAQLIQNDAKAGGIDIRLNVTDSSSYYGDAVFGKSPWLDSAMGITDYVTRGVPNTYLAAPLLSDGTWNAAHFKNKQYDALVAEYTRAIDLQSQRKAAKSIALLLLDESPLAISYFYNYLTATKKNVAGIDVTAGNQLDLTKAGFTS